MESDSLAFISGFSQPDDLGLVIATSQVCGENPQPRKLPINPDLATERAQGVRV